MFVGGHRIETRLSFDRRRVELGQMRAQVLAYGIAVGVGGLAIDRIGRRDAAAFVLANLWTAATERGEPVEAASGIDHVNEAGQLTLDLRRGEPALHLTPHHELSAEVSEPGLREPPRARG